MTSVLFESPTTLDTHVPNEINLYKDDTPSLIVCDDPQPIAEVSTIHSVNESVPTIIPSDEQQFIITKLGEGHNVVADCVAGSGKTTTILFLAEQYPDKKILQVTYNKNLKCEVREKADTKGLINLEIHTYHSACVKYYNRLAHTDGPMRTVIERNTPPIRVLPVYDIVVIDEVQDMTPLYYRFIKKLLLDCTNSPVARPSLLVLGDRYQAINQYNKADSRFITLCRHIWERPFVSATLSRSYRLTDQIASFVNDIMLGESRIRTAKSGPPVKYIITNTFNDVSYIASIITDKLKEGYRAYDIFILAPSIKKSSAMTPIRKLENKLVELGVPCYYPTSDDSEIDNNIVAGKVIFCTFHQSKGRERSIVVVYSFDSSYFTFYAKDSSPLVCPNTLYVAPTRARNELIVIRHNDNNKSKPLQFLQIDHERELALKEYVSLIGLPYPNTRSIEINMGKHTSSVTDMTKHLKEHSMYLLNNLCAIIFTQTCAAVHSVSITSKLSSSNGMVEDVSELNGLIIPGLYERQTRKISTIEQKVSSSKPYHPLVAKLYSETNMSTPTLVDYTQIAAMYYSITEELLNKIAQIPRFNWLTEEAVSACHAIMKNHIPDNTTYETEIDLCDYTGFPKYGSLSVRGRMDVITDTDVYELKCVQEIKLEHKLQLLIYAWLWEVSGRCKKEGRRRFKLLNARSGELWELDTSSPLLKDAIEIILECKYGKIEEKSDSVFIEECLKY